MGLNSIHEYINHHGRKLNITHVATHHNVTRGGAFQLCRLAAGQHRLGHNVTVVVYKRKIKKGSFFKQIPKETIQKNIDSWSQLTSHGISVRFINYTSISGKKELKKIICSHDTDIVHAHRSLALEICYKILKNFPHNVFIAQRGTITRPNKRVIRKIMNSSRVHAVTCVSKAVRDSDNIFVQDHKKLHCIYGSVDLSSFHPRTPDASKLSQLKLPNDAYIVGSLSSYRREKGLEELIEALDHVMDDYEHVYAVFIGTGVRRNLSRLVTMKKNNGRFFLFDHQNDIPSWLSIMDLTVVNAFDCEGLSGVIRESLAMEIPVISTDHAGNKEIILHKQTGLLVKQQDTENLKENIRWAVAHPREMKAMAQTGRKWVEKNCATQVQTENFISLYRAYLEKVRKQQTN